MKRILASLVVACCCLTAFAQNAKLSREEYIQKYAQLAVMEMQRTGIPASITLAQACLESSNGNSDLAIASNNHFGIKCHSSWQGKRIYHDDDAKGECFRVYNEVYDSYIDHSNFLRNGQRYAPPSQVAHKGRPFRPHDPRRTAEACPGRQDHRPLSRGKAPCRRS